MAFDDTWAIFICHTEQYILWRFKWHFFAIIIVNIIIFYVLHIQYSGGNISEKKHYCWVILDLHNMPLLQVNASQWPKNNWFWGNRFNVMAQGMEVTLRQNIMIQLFYVINNIFRDMMRKNWVNRDTNLCKLLAPKVLVTVLKNSGCVIFIEGSVFIKINKNINIKRVIMEGAKCDKSKWLELLLKCCLTASTTLAQLFINAYILHRFPEYKIMVL